jgi:hypothetical protein
MTDRQRDILLTTRHVLHPRLSPIKNLWNQNKLQILITLTFALTSQSPSSMPCLQHINTEFNKELVFSHNHNFTESLKKYVLLRYQWHNIKLFEKNV